MAEQRTEQTIRVRQVTDAQVSWSEHNRGEPGAFTIQLILDNGAEEYIRRSSSAASCSPPSSPIPTPNSPRSGRQSRRSEPARLRPDLRGYEPFAGSDGCSVAGVEDGFRAALLARFLTVGAGKVA